MLLKRTVTDPQQRLAKIGLHQAIHPQSSPYGPTPTDSFNKNGKRASAVLNNIEDYYPVFRHLS